MHEVTCGVGDEVLVGGEPIARVLTVGDGEVTLGIRDPEADTWLEVTLEIGRDGVAEPAELPPAIR